MGSNNAAFDINFPNTAGVLNVCPWRTSCTKRLSDFQPGQSNVCGVDFPLGICSVSTNMILDEHAV